MINLKILKKIYKSYGKNNDYPKIIFYSSNDINKKMVIKLDDNYISILIYNITTKKLLQKIILEYINPKIIVANYIDQGNLLEIDCNKNIFDVKFNFLSHSRAIL